MYNEFSLFNDELWVSGLAAAKIVRAKAIPKLRTRKTNENEAEIKKERNELLLVRAAVAGKNYFNCSYLFFVLEICLIFALENVGEIQMFQVTSLVIIHNLLIFFIYSLPHLVSRNCHIVFFCY